MSLFFAYSALLSSLLISLLYYGHIDMSIDTVYKLYGNIECDICTICLWTHILTYAMILLYSGKDVPVLHRPTGTHKQKECASYVRRKEKPIHRSTSKSG